MNSILNIIEIIKDKKAFDIKCSETQDKLYLTEKESFTNKGFWHNELPDGLIENNNIYLNCLELEIFTDHFQKLGFRTNFSTGYYQADFLNINEIGCNGNIVILSRYFKPKTSNIAWGSSPRGLVSKNIHDSKDSSKSENIMDWDDNFVIKLRDFLITFIKKALKDIYDFQSETMRKDYGPKVVLTSLPNRNRNNRFSLFLEMINSELADNNLLIANDFFLQTKQVDENTRYMGYQKKKETLAGLYKVNTKYEYFYNNNTKIFILDDVLTTGVHFELALEALKIYLNNKYEVSGIFMSATQSNEDYRNKNFLKLKNSNFVI